MSALVSAAIWAWPFVTLLMFMLMTPRKAVGMSVLAGWLFLPVQTVSMQGFLDIDKTSIIALSCVLAVGLLDTSRLLSFRPQWIDLPTCLWCCAGLPASLTNDLGLYDGLSITLESLLHWGAFWFLGRLYLTDLPSLRYFTKAIFTAGLIYAPLCLWEVRMSPTLHSDIYGVSVYNGITYAQDLGKWGSRPSVFLRNPLELGLFLSSACLCGYALLAMNRKERVFGTRIQLALAFLVLASLACKNLGATLLMCMGVLIIRAVQRRRSWVPVVALSAVFPVYVGLRATALWDGEQITRMAAMVHEQKAQSFGFRLLNEDLLLQRALERPLCGWGGWGRSRVFDENGKDISIADGLWVIALGMSGLWGLLWLILTMAIPAIRVRQRFGPAVLRSPAVTPVVLYATLIALMFVDFIPNNFPSPLILMGGGGVVTLHSLALRGPRPGRGSRAGSTMRRVQAARQLGGASS